MRATLFGLMAGAVASISLAAGCTSGNGDATVDGGLDASADSGHAADGAPDAAVQPIRFVVRNTTAATVYLDWSYAGETVVAGEVDMGAGWEAIAYLRPNGCKMPACEQVNPADPSTCETGACGIMYAVRVLEPGQEVEVTWDGQFVFTVDEAVCDHGCSEAHSVGAGPYRAIACRYDSFTCFFDPPCGPNQGIYEPAQVEGTGQCAQTEFAIPLDGDEVVIELS